MTSSTHLRNGTDELFCFGPDRQAEAFDEMKWVPAGRTDEDLVITR